MDHPSRLTLADHFASLDDPRMERHPKGTRLHPLLSIVTMAICAVIGGAKSWDDIELFGQVQSRLVRQLPGPAEWYPIP